MSSLAGKALPRRIDKLCAAVAKTLFDSIMGQMSLLPTLILKYAPDKELFTVRLLQVDDQS